MIKKVEEKDIDTIVELEKKLLGQTLGRSYLSHLAEIDMAGVFKYEEEKIIKGYISFTINGDYIEILNVLVDPNYQRKGIGTKLVEAVSDFMSQNKLKSIILEVNINNTNAQSLYLKNGFEKMLVRKNFYKTETGLEDAVVMIKERI